MPKGVDDFLGPDPQPEPEPQAAPPETQAQAPEPEPQQLEQGQEPELRHTDQQVDENAPSPEPETDDGQEPPPGNQNRAGSAFSAIRKEAKDHKGRADRAEGELAALRTEREREAAERADYARQLAEMRQQMDEMRKQAAPAPEPPPQAPQIAPLPPMPNPIEYPEDFQNWMAMKESRDQQIAEDKMFNARLDMSEAMLRQQVGDDDVNAKLATFQKAARANPALGAQIRTQKHPWAWMYDQAKRIDLMEEMGTDPNAYRAKMEADIRAKTEEELRAKVRADLEAEMKAQQEEALKAMQPAQQQPQRVVQLPTPMGTMRSQGTRDEPVANVATDFDDILGKFKRKQG